MVRAGVPQHWIDLLRHSPVTNFAPTTRSGAFILFEGEGHGFRKAENMKIALEKELAFYRDVFGIKGAS